MFNKDMLVVPSTICTSLRKCQPTLLAQVVSCRDVSVKQEQGINVEASRLCVTSGQSGWGYCWAASAVPVICRTSCSNFLIHPSLVLFSCFAVLWISKDMIHRGMRTPMQWCRFPKKRNDKVGCVPPNKGGSVVEESTLSTGLALQKKTKTKTGLVIRDKRPNW